MADAKKFGEGAVIIRGGKVVGRVGSGGGGRGDDALFTQEQAREFAEKQKRISEELKRKQQAQADAAEAQRQADIKAQQEQAQRDKEVFESKSAETQALILQDRARREAQRQSSLKRIQQAKEQASQAQQEQFESQAERLKKGEISGFKVNDKGEVIRDVAVAESLVKVSRGEPITQREREVLESKGVEFETAEKEKPVSLVDLPVVIQKTKTEDVGIVKKVANIFIPDLKILDKSPEEIKQLETQLTSGELKEIFLGEQGSAITGFGSAGGLQPLVTTTQLKQALGENFGLKGKVFGEFIPTTPAETGIIAGVGTASVFGPAIAQVGLGLGVGGLGIAQATDPEALPEERIAGGIVGGLGLLGAGSVFLKGKIPVVKGKKGAVRLESEFVEFQGRFVKKVDVDKLIQLEKVRTKLKTGSNKETETFIKNQLNLIKNKNIPNAEKITQAKELQALVVESKGGIVIRDAQGNILGAEGFGNKVTSPEPIKVNVDVSGVGVGAVVDSGILTDKPTIVGGQGGQSLFTGQAIKTSDLQSGFQQQATAQDQQVKQVQLLKLSAATQEVTKQEEKIKQAEKVLQIPLLSPLLKTTQRQRARETLIQRQIQRQQLRQRRSTGKTKIPKRSGVMGALIKRVKAKPEQFEVFGRRNKQDFSLGTFETKSKAESGLKNFLTKTLARSGFIKNKGEKITSDLLKSPIFRSAKREPKRVVQRSKFSLGSGSEVSEIQFFKKKSSKKNSKFGMFS